MRSYGGGSLGANCENHSLLGPVICKGGTITNLVQILPFRWLRDGEAGALDFLFPEEDTAAFDWPGKIAETISRLPAVRAKIDQVVEFRRNDTWWKVFAEIGFPSKPYTGSLSVYSSDVESLKELISTILKENEVHDSSPLWLVGYDEPKISKTPEDPSKPMPKLMGVLKRNSSLTTPQFHEYWSTTHAARFCSRPIIQEKVAAYTQFHSSPEWTEDFAKMGLNLMIYEGVVEIWFDTLEEMISLFGNKDQVGEIMADDGVFLDLGGGGIMVGVDKLETERYTSSHPLD